jgi:capsid assembly protease
MKRYSLRTGEFYAIKPSFIERDADGFFLVMGRDPAPNEARGSVVVVHIRGALSQWKGEGGDSYESIVERVGDALKGKPSAVVLSISSPGGLVAGLNECVFKLQRMRVEAETPLIAQINELAASAAFAISCACDRRFAPPSAIVGSIGTISTMVSVARQDEANGVDFRIITSGARKSDGHPHQLITEAAVKAETARNAQLAEQFVEIAAKALRQSPRKLEALEAAIYVGENARKVGLINAVRSLDETIGSLDRSEIASPSPSPNEGNVTDRRAKDLDSSSAPGSTFTHPGSSQTRSTTWGKHADQSEGLDRKDGGRARERDRPRTTTRP